MNHDLFPDWGMFDKVDSYHDWIVVRVGNLSPNQVPLSSRQTASNQARIDQGKLKTLQFSVTQGRTLKCVPKHYRALSEARSNSSNHIFFPPALGASYLPAMSLLLR